MSDFKAKMHQNRFRLHGAPPQTPLGSLQRSPRPLARFKGPTSKGREREERDGRTGEGREVRGGEGRGKGPEGRGAGTEGKGMGPCLEVFHKY